MLNKWFETFNHEVVEKLWRFITIEVSDQSGVLFYSIDKLVDYGVMKQIPQHTVHTRKRFPTKEEAVTYLKGGIECLKYSNPELIPTLRKYGL